MAVLGKPFPCQGPGTGVSAFLKAHGLELAVTGQIVYPALWSENSYTFRLTSSSLSQKVKKSKLIKKTSTSDYNSLDTHRRTMKETVGHTVSSGPI